MSFVDIVEGSRIVADLALQALADAEEFATNGTPLPGISAAAMFQALWEQGSRWDDEALVLCAEFCTLVDLVELCGAAALTCASDGLSPAVSETVIVCLEENPRQPLLDVRNAVISTLK